MIEQKNIEEFKFLKFNRIVNLDLREVEINGIKFDAVVYTKPTGEIKQIYLLFTKNQLEFKEIKE